MKSNNIKLTDGNTYNIGTMFCIGQNYAKHIVEMGAKKSTEPVVFIKPPQALLNNGEILKLPTFSNNVHHEVELVVLIGQDCYNIEVDEANKYIAGYGIGLDITARDIQEGAKKLGKPWALAKSFRHSAPVSDFIPAKEVINNSNFDLKLFINNKLVQSGNTSDMERSIEELISYLSKIYSLKKGDVIFTGTPEGVGQIKSNDILEAKLNDTISLKINVE